MRRQAYRHAREVLLQARGYQTLCAVAEADHHSNTVMVEPQGPPPGAAYWLTQQDRSYPLKVGINTVGRSEENDVVVADGCVSRRHCAILVHVSSGCELHDTASKNGTFLNGNRIAGPTRLRPGDEIRMCDQQFVFQALPDAPLGPPRDDATFTQ
jgi:pSer/pThr/pTyr-binding forkhead associated (FHA) protein